MAQITTANTSLDVACDGDRIHQRGITSLPNSHRRESSRPRQILIVEDEAPTRSLLAEALTVANFQSHQAMDGRSAVAWLAASHPDLLLIDWALPDISGPDLIRRLRSDRATRQLPIILLSKHSQLRKKIEGLESGADDYITKPFSIPELIVRTKAALRRYDAVEPTGAVRTADLMLDPISQQAFSHSRGVRLSDLEYRILAFFMTHPEHAHARHQIAEAVWGGRAIVEQRTVDANVRRLRAVLSVAKCDHLIQTVRGVGYRFSAQPSGKLKT